MFHVVNKGTWFYLRIPSSRITYYKTQTASSVTQLQGLTSHFKLTSFFFYPVGQMMNGNFTDCRASRIRKGYASQVQILLEDTWLISYLNISIKFYVSSFLMCQFIYLQCYSYNCMQQLLQQAQFTCFISMNIESIKNRFHHSVYRNLTLYLCHHLIF